MRVAQIRRVRPAETAWESALWRGARRGYPRAAWADGGEIPRRPGRAHAVRDWPPALARSCVRRRTCRRQSAAIPAPTRGPRRLRREWWRDRWPVDLVFGRPFPCREIDSAAWRYGARRGRPPISP